MGYVFAFFLGIYVATVGVADLAQLLEQSLHTTQQYMKENAKAQHPSFPPRATGAEAKATPVLIAPATAQ